MDDKSGYLRVDLRKYMTDEQKKKFDDSYIDCIYKSLYEINTITEEQLIQLLARKR